MSTGARERPAWELSDLALAAMAVLLASAAGLWAGAWASASLRGLQPPAFGINGTAGLLAHPDDPPAWGTPMPGPVRPWWA